MTRRAHAAGAIAVLILGSTALPGIPSAVGQPGSPAVRGHAVSLVVDTSGSMNENDGTGRVKIDGARTALIDFVRALPGDSRVGLRTYPGGEPVAGGCRPGDQRFDVGKQNLTQVDAVIRSLKAEGETPTAAALEAAARDLKDRGPATIVLVSDGESNCGPDPCQVTRQIVASGIDVTINTVGFQLSNAGRAQLQCIAGAANGRYVDVANTAELARELDRLARPVLDIRLRYAQHPVKAVVGENSSGLVNVAAEVTAIGATAVRDVQASMTFTVDRAPALLSPRRRLGNLTAGQSHTVNWAFRPPLEEQPRGLPFEVVVRGANSPPVTARGTIQLDPQFNLADAGPLLRDKKQVVILGDSYSAGEGAGDYLPGTDTSDNGCHRSRSTYGIALFEGEQNPGGQVDLFACSGAVAADMLSPNGKNAGEPAQVAHLGAKLYDVALLTLGGNDIDFGGLIRVCAVEELAGNCADYRPVTGVGKTMRERTFERLDGLTATLKDTLGVVESVLNSKQHLQDRKGPAPLVVLAYPFQFPLGRGANQFFCSAEFRPADLAFFQDVGLALSSRIEAAVDALRAEGRPVYYASDVIDSFQPDHTYCGREPWVHKIGLSGVVGGARDMLDEGIQRAAGADKGFWDAVYSHGIPLTIAGRVVKLLDQPGAARLYKEQLHPTRQGYKAMTSMLVRWSTSPEARAPVTRRPQPSIDLAPAGRTADVRVSVDAGSPSLEGGTLNVQPASTIELQASGLMPYSPAEVVLRSLPRLLGRATADGQGVARLVVTVPASTRIGRHHLELTALRADGSPLDVYGAMQVSRRRPPWVPALALAGLAALLAGLVLYRRAAVR